MSINKSGIEGSGYVHGMSCISVIESPEMCDGDRSFSVKEKVVAKEKREGKKLNITCSSSSTSSIGKNSDISSKSMEDDSGDTEEVQSSYRGPLDAMEALEEVLPIRRGISRFYNGKSKSFASLGDGSSSSSVKDIAKPENAYMKRRRNILFCGLAWDKNRSSPLKSNGRVSKRVTYSNRATLALAVSMSNSSNSGSKSSNDNNLSSCINSIVGSPLLRCCLNRQVKDYNLNGSSLSPPRHDFSALRPLSLADLQHFVSITASCTASAHLDMKPSHT